MASKSRALKLPVPVAKTLAAIPVKLAYRITDVCTALRITPKTIHYWDDVLGLHAVCRCQDTHRQWYYRRPQVEKIVHARYLSQKQGLSPKIIRQQLCST
jgi:DNA-binding transcriptional MerR regulator